MSGEGAATLHLSIGEVLAFLQEEFPDVTISKIRFLESQGLIQPDRTASGYRKFYESDIERLQWILRQQRDHFLPLKVIRKMLDEGVDKFDPGGGAQPTLWTPTDEDESGEPEPAAVAGGPPRSPAHPAVASAAAAAPAPAAPAAVPATPSEEPVADTPAPALSPRPAEAAPVRRGDGRVGGRPPVREPVTAGSASRSGASAAGSASGGPSTPATRLPGAPAQASTSSTGASSAPASSAGSSSAPASSAGSSSAGAGGGSRGADRPGRPGDSGAGPGGARPTLETPADVVAALQEDPRTARGGRAQAGAEPGAVPVPSGHHDALVTPPPADPDTELNAAELCGQAGIDEALLAGLEQYGLVVGQARGGETVYGGEALQVARLAARYAELGVEPRHLRMYLVSAEREAGFVEQLAVPFLKQRNPQARTQATDLATELSDMGADLHRILLRRELGGDLLG